jgi:glycosyltransferase involved in cell wall biosynthesis
MKVLLISHTCSSRQEGQPKARLLARQPDLQLRVIVPDRWNHYGQWRPAQPPDPPDFDLSIEKIRCPWLGLAQWYLHWYPRLKKILREFQPDIIDLWEEPWGLVSAHACRLRNRFLPGAVVISETEQNINKQLPFPFERFRRYTLQNADYVIGRNTESIQVLRDKGYTGPAEVVPNAVDAELFRPMNRDQCRISLGIKNLTVGYVGRLVEEKGLTDLVDSLPLCFPQVNLLFVGDGPLRSLLQQRAQSLGVANRVQFLAAKPLADLPPLMNAFLALALPSRTTRRWKEQFGRVIIEAHACSIPVIGSNSGAIPHVIDKGGLVVPESSPRELADAINKLAADPAGAASMGLVGRKQVEENYTWGQVAQRMADIYRRSFAVGRASTNRLATPQTASG